MRLLVERWPGRDLGLGMADHPKLVVLHQHQTEVAEEAGRAQAAVQVAIVHLLRDPQPQSGPVLCLDQSALADEQLGAHRIAEL